MGAKVMDEKKLQEIRVPPLESETTPAKELYFSDLSDEQVMKLFGESPSYRFESFCVYLKYDISCKTLKLFGFIEAAEFPVFVGVLSPDPMLDYGLSKLLNFEYNEPLVVPNRYIYLADNYHCSVPFSSYIQIRAKLHIFTGNEEDDEDETVDNFFNEAFKDGLFTDELKIEDDYNEWEEDKVTTHMKDDMEKDNDELEEDLEKEIEDKVPTDMEEDLEKEIEDKVSTDMEEDLEKEIYAGNKRLLTSDYFDLYGDGSLTLKEEEEDAKKSYIYDSEVYQEFQKAYLNFCPKKVETEDDKVNDNELFEICNESLVFDLSDYLAKKPNGGVGSFISNGKDGLLQMFYVLLKYAVDAALEVEFVVTTSKKIKVDGRVKAYYGKGFNYNCPSNEKPEYGALLLKTKPDDVVKPGKINLVRSVLAVPAQFSLLIEANLHDSTSRKLILTGVYEFPVPCEGGSSVGSIEGVDFSLKLKVDWKLPRDVLSL